MYKIISIILAILLIVSLFLTNNYRKQRDDLSNQIENTFKQKYKYFEKQLNKMESERDSLRQLYHKLDSANKELQFKIKSGEQEISKIKGRYDKLNSSELARKMIQNAREAD